jgi:arylsulfatase A-like enzyme
MIAFRASEIVSRSRRWPVRMSRVPPLAALVALSCLSACGREALAKGKPNLVVVVVDTLRADAVLDPEGRVATPALDALAAEGAAFPRAYSHAPMTLPSHTALFSSRYPHESGVLVNGNPVPEDLPLLGKHLESLGYRTAAVVSLTTLVRASAGAKSLDQGFDHYERAPGHIAPADVVAERLRVVLDDLAKDGPFFLFAHFADPHEPYDAHGSLARSAEVRLNGELLERVSTSDATSFERELELRPGENVLELRGDTRLVLRFLRCSFGREALEPRFLEGAVREPGLVVRAALDNPAAEPRRARVSFWLTDEAPLAEHPERYAREVEFADRYVGELLAELKQRGLYDESLLVFTSDHGEALGERGGSGHVHSLFEELMHVPLVVKPPRASPALEALRARTGEVVSHVDVVPTVLELLGLPPLAGQRGRSLLGGAPTAPTFAETHRPEALHDLLSLRDARWKLIYVADQDRFQLYDLEKDPGEKRDVFKAEGKRFAAWQERLRDAAEVAKDSTLDMDGIDPAVLEQMRAIGYFGK